MLSGYGEYLPDGLQQVARTLDALRAAPLPAELGSEDAVRTAFRMIMTQGSSGAPQPSDVTSGGTEIGAPVLPGRHRRPRPRPFRRSPFRGGLSRGVNWPIKVLAAAVGVVVIGGGVALAGTLSDSGGHRSVAANGTLEKQTTSAASVSPSHGVDGNATPEAAAKSPAATASPAKRGPSPRELCTEFFTFYADQGQGQQPSAALQADFNQLKSRAEGSENVGYYCMRVLQVWTQPQRSSRSSRLPAYRPSDSQGSNGQGRDNANGGNTPGYGGNN